MTGIVWLDGALVAAGLARIDPADRGFLLGDGLFETMRVERCQVLHRGRHLARLRLGAATLALPVPYDDAAIAAAIAELLAANRLDDAALRLTLTAGIGPRGLGRPPGLQPTMVMSVVALAPAAAPAALVIAQGTRRNEHSPLSRIKALGYGDQILARREAAARGADDAILLNGAGALVCATAANLLLYDGAAWLTPPVAAGALPGIERGLLVEAGLAREQPLFPEDLRHAKQLLLINSLEWREVARVENRMLQPRAELAAALRNEVCLL